ncbi:unnamed protein product, partial [Effrenium voratum]
AIGRAGQLIPWVAADPSRASLPALAETFSAELLAACEVLDTTKKVNAGPEVVQNSITALLTLAADPDAVAALQRSAIFGANLYVYSMQCLQAAALMQNRTEWTTELAKQLGALPEQARLFLQSPHSDEALLAALAACHGAQAAGQVSVSNPTDPLAGGTADSARAASTPAATQHDDPLMSGANPAPAGPTLFAPKRKAPEPTAAPPAKKAMFMSAAKALADASEESFADDQFYEFALQGLPAALKQKHGVPATAPADLAGTVAANAAKAVQIRQEVAQFHVERAAAWSLRQHGVLPAAEDSKYGLLVLMQGHKQFPDSGRTDTLNTCLTKLKKTPPPAEAEETLTRLQQKLIVNVTTATETGELLSKIQVLCQEARRAEPRAEHIKECLERIPKVLQILLDLSSPKKYAKIKARSWKNDLAKLLPLRSLPPTRTCSNGPGRNWLRRR